MSFRYLGAWLQNGAFDPLVAPTIIFDNYLYSWGRNVYGELGLGNTTSYSSPKQVGALSNWLSVASGVSHTASIKTDGTFWSWGRNNVGQLGLGNTTNYSSPKQVGILTNWEKVSCGRGGAFGGGTFTLAIKTNGTLWSWGSNGSGQLGLGDSSDRSSPVQIGALTDWLSVACGGDYTAAIKTNGTIWAWGENGRGQLGLGNTTNYSSPKQIGALTDWSYVACGYEYTVAIKANGTLWGWGYNALYGSLGLGNTTNYSSPKQIGALTNWLKVSCGTYFTTAIKTDGTLWAWGRNNGGQLGLGDASDRSSPVQVGALNTWATLGTGNQCSFAVKTDKTVWSWGTNTYGQLGLGDTSNRSSPVQIGSATNWSSLTSGLDSSVGITSTVIVPYIQYGGLWNLSSQTGAKAANNWP
jgi:alpha-tubulin suppressor-like RCC1 family protein